MHSCSVILIVLESYLEKIILESLHIIEFWRNTILVNVQMQHKPHNIRNVFREDYFRILIMYCVQHLRWLILPREGLSRTSFECTSLREKRALNTEC